MNCPSRSPTLAQIFDRWGSSQVYSLRARVSAAVAEAMARPDGALNAAGPLAPRLSNSGVGVTGHSTIWRDDLSAATPDGMNGTR